MEVRESLISYGWLLGHLRIWLWETDLKTDKPLKPWGFWATGGFSLLVGIGLFCGQAMVAAAFVGVALFKNPDLDATSFVQELASHGFFLIVATCVSAPVGIALISWFAVIKKDWSVRTYLALAPVRPTTLFSWLGLVLLFIIFSDGLSVLLGRSIVPDFMTQIYETASFLPLLWFTVILVAPLSEEMLFRGFMFRGWEHSRIGPWAAVILTSILFAAIHLQYDAYGVAMVFGIGFLLGLARFKTRSLYTSMVMHSFFNFVATMEAHWAHDLRMRASGTLADLALVI